MHFKFDIDNNIITVIIISGSQGTLSEMSPWRRHFILRFFCSFVS